MIDEARIIAAVDQFGLHLGVGQRLSHDERALARFRHGPAGIAHRRIDGELQRCHHRAVQDRPAQIAQQPQYELQLRAHPQEQQRGKAAHGVGKQMSPRQPEIMRQPEQGGQNNRRACNQRVEPRAQAFSMNSIMPAPNNSVNRPRILESMITNCATHSQPGECGTAKALGYM